MAALLQSFPDPSPYTTSGYQQHEILYPSSRMVHFQPDIDMQDLYSQDLQDLQGLQNIDPSLCATLPTQDGSMPLPPSQHMSLMAAPNTIVDKGNSVLATVGTLSPPSSFSCESDPYDSDATPATPENHHEATPVFFLPQSQSRRSAGSRLSPQPSSLLRTGGHLEYMGVARYVSPKDVNSISAMLASAIESDDAALFRESYYPDMYHFDPNSSVPQYNPQDAGHTLDDGEGHQPYNYAGPDIAVPRTLSPEPLVPLYFKEEAVGDGGDDSSRKNSDDSTSSTIYAYGVVATDDQHESTKRRRSSTAASTIEVAGTSKRRRNNDGATFVPPSPPSKSLPAPNTMAIAPTEPALSSFSQQAKLKDHRKREHDRPFVCLFVFAGCKSAFGNKNEWKRHVMAQHIMLKYWRCDDSKCERMRNSIGGCAYGDGSSNIGGTAYHASEQNNSGIFNRKDLFTQHVRRMHMSDELKVVEKKYKKDKRAWEQEQAAGRTLKGVGSGGHVSKGKGKRKRVEAGAGDETTTATAAVVAALPPVEEPAELRRWNEELAVLQDRSGVVRCSLPTAMTCPECADEFHGDKAWAERLEHVAGHMQAAHEASRRPWPYGGLSDPTLTCWAEHDDVRIVQRSGSDDGHVRWTLNKPLQQVAGGGSTAAPPESEDDDVEDEDYFS